MTTPPEPISLQAAADQLSVHYMTAYRYVRTGRLHATKVGGQWQVDPADLSNFVAGDADGVPVKAATSVALQNRLIANDAAGAWQICQSALASGFTPERVYIDLLAPALTNIGEQWSTGDITIAQEHLASTTARRIMGQLSPAFHRRGRRRGTIIVGSPSGDMHALPSAMFADLLRTRAFDAIDLGANTPGESFAEVADKADDLLGVGIVVTGTDGLSAARSTIAAARTAGLRAPIIAGGLAITSTAEALALGADHGSTSTEGSLALFESLAASFDPAQSATDQRD